MKAKQQQRPVLQVVDPKHHRIRLAIARYDKEHRRYREEMSFRIRVDQAGMDVLIERFRAMIAAMDT